MIDLKKKFNIFLKIIFSLGIIISPFIFISMYPFVINGVAHSFISEIVREIGVDFISPLLLILYVLIIFVLITNLPKSNWKSFLMKVYFPVVILFLLSFIYVDFVSDLFIIW